jgi:hypothetical protein
MKGQLRRPIERPRHSHAYANYLGGAVGWCTFLRRQSRKFSSTELNILLIRFLYLRGCFRELIIEK